MSSSPRDSTEPLFTTAFLRLSAFTFTTFFSAFQLFPAVPFRILELGGSRAAAGGFLALYTWSCAFSAPLTGALADHFGRRRVLVGGASLFVLFSLLYGVVSTWPLLLAVAALHGVFWSAILSSSAAVLNEAIPASRRTEGIAAWGMASTAAVAVAPAVGLAVHRRYGWTALCVEMAVLSAGMALLALRVKGGESRREGPLPPLASLLDGRVLAAGTALMAVSFSYGGVTSYIALLALERGVTPPSLFFTVFSLAMVLSRLATSRFGDSLGPRALLLPSLATIPTAVVLVALAHDRLSLTIAGLLFGLGFAGAYPAFAAWALGRSDPARAGATFGSVLWAFDTGIGAGSLATGQLVGRYGFRTAFLAAAAVSALAIPLFLALAPLLEGRRRAASGS